METGLDDAAVPAIQQKRFCATFDIEDWFHAENVRASLPTHDWDRLESRLEPNVHELLDILAAARVRSTFFVLGWVAERYPAVVQRIVRRVISADSRPTASPSGPGSRRPESCRPGSTIRSTQSSYGP